jgi:hypothetical protein
MIEPTAAPLRAMMTLASKIQYLYLLLALNLWPNVSSAQVIPPAWQPTEQSQVYDKLYLNYWKEASDSIIAEQKLREKAFEQQQYVGWTILILVTLMTAGGFAFSLALILRATSLSGSQPVSDLEVTLQRIKLSSIQTASLVGLVVYLSSLGFLYLYMLRVSDISAVVEKHAGSAAQQTAPLLLPGESASPPWRSQRGELSIGR